MRRKTGPGKVDERVLSCPRVEALLYNFDFDWHEVKPEHQAWLDRHVVPEACSHDSWIWMRGTASKIGADQYNLDLSQRRVEAVAQYLLTKGVLGSQIQTQWAGERLSTSAKKDDERDRAVEVRFQSVLPPPVADLPPEPPKKPPPPECGSRSFKVRMLGQGAASKIVSPGKIIKAIKQYKKLKKWKKIPKVGPTVELALFEIHEHACKKSAIYILFAGGVGAGALDVSYSHKGPWNPFTTSKAITAAQFGGFTRYGSLGAFNLGIAYLHLAGTPDGVDGVYISDFKTGVMAGAGVSWTIGDLVLAGTGPSAD